MSTPRFSQSPALHTVAKVFALIPIAIGINAILRPQHALTLFDFTAPASPIDAKLVDSLVAVYGARDIFMGLAVYAAAYFADRKTLGAILIAAGGAAFADGAVVRAQVGRGEWSHWGFVPVLTVFGSAFLGAFDRA
ncbi:hypothetical protein FPV67DRAFT_304710 [Lyophyllum atratum]|nr:hypothetical protein FPV67DRAFT_304710 [Lyophyllum atratum]